jgi:hypothetical protein
LQGACEMYSDALEKIEADGKEAMGQDIYRQAIGEPSLGTDIDDDAGKSNVINQ